MPWEGWYTDGLRSNKEEFILYEPEMLFYRREYIAALSRRLTR
jgi:hypothetical protein